MQKRFLQALSLLVMALLMCVCNVASADVYADFEKAGTRNDYHGDPNVNSRRTDHFLIRFGPKPREGFMVEQLFQGQMQFLENTYDTWQALGLHPLGGTDPNTKYKLIIEPAETWDGDTPGTAVSFGETISGSSWVPGIHVPCNSLGYKYPNGCTPHECGHGWQNQGGLPVIQPPGLTESLANWIMQQQLAGYPQDWIVVGMPYGHAAASYNCLSIFNYFMEAPGYGANFINKLIFDPNLNSWSNVTADDIIRKAIRVDISGAVDKAAAIHDGLGMMNAKMLDMDFWNHRVNHVYTYDSDTSWFTTINGMPQGYQFNRIPMVKQPGVSGTWYRPEFTCIPQWLSNNYIPLNITASGSRRIISCDFRPVADAVRGTSFRACFVAFNQNKEPRYGRVWNTGINSFTLADDENTVYLAVIACPSSSNAAIVHNDYTTDNVAMFPYRLSLTGATPKGFQWASPANGSYHHHTNGGGKVANTATVDASAYVGPNAMVLGTAKVYGNSRIEDYAVVSGSAVIGRSGQPDNPVLSGHAYVTDTAQVYGHAKVRDYGWVWGASKIYDNAIVMAHSMINGATVCGGAVMNQAPLRDPGLCFSGTYSGCAQVGGDCSSLGVSASDKGVWCEYPAISVADNAYQYLGYNFEKKSCVFAMDQYGMNHSYLMNEPQVVSDTINSVVTNVLALNGTNQYVELRPDAVDFPDLTITAWVKWSGGAEDQKIFSCGNGSNKVMYLSPLDGNTGKLRFAISDGTSTQYLDWTAGLTANTWTHVAITLSGNTGTLYINGTQVVQNTSMTIDPDQLHAALQEDANYIGRGNAGNYFSGRIDEFKVFNKALSSAEVLTVKGTVKAGTAVAADTTPPTPSTSTWLVAPTVKANNAITMSATPGTDAGGNGVLYYFRCVNDANHDSGWISENTYTDCNCDAGTTYTYAVTMKDKKGNTGTESAQMSAATPALDTTPPTPSTPTFAVGPKGTSTTSISMTATKGVDDDETVMYRFNRVVPGLGTILATSGWTSSRTWNDTGLTSGSSYYYTVQMMDGHGNTTATSAVASAVARDDTPPALDSDFRMQWDTYPYTQLDKTVRLSARPLDETNVEYYFECVEMPTINSGWTANKMWVSPALPDGTYSFRFKIRDKSPQLNQTTWSTSKTAKILTTNSYHDYTLSQLSGLPDSTLVKFSGKVSQVNPDSYIVSTLDNSASIRVVPRTFGYQADATLLNQNVYVKGHLWTFTGSPKQVTGAIVWGNPQVGKVEFENCEYDDDLARLLYNTNASGSEYLGWYQSGWSVTIPNVAATSQLSLCYNSGAGKISLYVNGGHYKDLSLPSTGSVWGSATFTGLSIPPNATLKLQADSGDLSPDLDYMILGSSYTISGKVTNASGAAIAGATVFLSGAPNASLNPTYLAITDASGNYSKTLPVGTWYVAAGAASKAYITSADQTVVLSSGNVANVNFTLQAITRVFPRPEDLLFSLVTDMLPDAGEIRSWMTYSPTGMTFTSGGVPSVDMINDVKWMKNSRATADCVKSPSYSSAIPINGATIVVAIKPQRDATSGYQWGLVSAFFDRLVLGIQNPTGLVRVNRLGVESYSSTAIPDGQMTVLSMVMQPTGQYKVYANGTQIMDVATTADMTSLVPSVHNTVAVGNNGPDGASTFNGDIGDVAFYKVALSDSERLQLEAAMSEKFGIKQYSITASAGSGGTITPTGVLVQAGMSQTFAIAPNTGYGISDVLVDGISVGAVSTYTFTNVMANHSIVATFVLMPPKTINATAGANGSITPSGAVSVAYNANQTFTITPNSGYSVSQVVVDGVNQGALPTYTFNNVTTDHTISATFVPYTGPAPIAWYQFENNVLDILGAYNGTAYNTPTYVTGKIGAKAIQFNGSNQYVSINRPVSNDFSIAFWVKTTQTSGTGYQWYSGKGLVDGEVGGNANDFGVTYLNSKVAFGIGNSDTTFFSTSTINSGNWTHVAVTRNSTTGQMKIYINGVLETTGTGPTGAKTSPNYLHIGNIQTNSNYFNGSIDQLKIYNVVLTASDVATLASEATTFPITASAGANGTITPSGTTNVTAGSNQTFAITPNAGYAVAGLVIDGDPAGAATSYTFSNVSASHSISATFAKVYGANNKSILTDAKLIGKAVKVWGKVKSINGSTFVMSDGYGASVTVAVNNTQLPEGFAVDKTVVVTGILSAGKTIQAQVITGY